MFGRSTHIIPRLLPSNIAQAELPAQSSTREGCDGSAWRCHAAGKAHLVLCAVTKYVSRLLATRPALDADSTNLAPSLVLDVESKGKVILDHNSFRRRKLRLEFEIAFDLKDSSAIREMACTIMLLLYTCESLMHATAKFATFFPFS